MLKAVAAPPAPDPGDRLLWELLAARADLVLVTGDRLSLADRSVEGRVIAAANFVVRAQV